MTNLRTKCAYNKACIWIEWTGTSFLLRSFSKRRTALVLRNPSRASNLKNAVSHKAVNVNQKKPTPADFSFADIFVRLACLDSVETFLSVIGLIGADIAF